MGAINILVMTAAELFGNTHLKWFAHEGRSHNLALGILAYAVVITFLIRSLASESMMWTCIMWEAAIVVGGAATAYFIFDEKFTHWVQWLGVVFALAAALCINYDASCMKR